MRAEKTKPVVKIHAFIMPRLNWDLQSLTWDGGPGVWHDSRCGAIRYMC
jgi:hypothetical protein